MRKISAKNPEDRCQQNQTELNKMDTVNWGRAASCVPNFLSQFCCSSLETSLGNIAVSGPQLHKYLHQHGQWQSRGHQLSRGLSLAIFKILCTYPPPSSSRRRLVIFKISSSAIKNILHKLHILLRKQECIINLYCALCILCGYIINNKWTQSCSVSS